MDVVTRHFTVEGRVQGVGFRRFAQKSAERFGLAGWVRNLADGRVEALAQGPARGLEEFEVGLKEGPLHSEVTAVAVKAVELKETLRHFVIERDGLEPWQND